jgi:hypothetical protein
MLRSPCLRVSVEYVSPFPLSGGFLSKIHGNSEWSHPGGDHSLIYRAFRIAQLRKIEDYVRAHLAESILIEMLAEFPQNGKLIST